jgi:hypothetical protein
MPSLSCSSARSDPPVQYLNNRYHGQNLRLTLGRAHSTAQYFFKNSTTVNTCCALRKKTQRDVRILLWGGGGRDDNKKCSNLFQYIFTKNALCLLFGTRACRCCQVYCSVHTELPKEAIICRKLISKLFCRQN